MSELAFPFFSSEKYKPRWLSSEEAHDKELSRLEASSKRVDLVSHEAWLFEKDGEVILWTKHAGRISAYYQVILCKPHGNKFDAKIAAVEVILWRDVAVSQTVTFSYAALTYYLNKYRCVISSDSHTADSKKVWNRIVEASLTGGRVWPFLSYVAVELPQRYVFISANSGIRSHKFWKEIQKTLYTEGQDYTGEHSRIMLLIGDPKEHSRSLQEIIATIEQ